MSDPNPDDLDFRREFGERVGADITIRALAQKSGWGKTTVHDLVGGSRLPNPVQLEDLLIAAGAEPAEVEQWQQRLDRLPQAPPDSRAHIAARLQRTVNGTTSSSAKRRRVRMRWAGAVVLLMLFAGIGFLAGRLSVLSPPPSRVFMAAVAKVSNTTGLGVDLYRGPARSIDRTGRGVGGGSGGSDRVSAGRREVIIDRVGGKVLQWPVWDRLANNTFVPDICTSTNWAYTPAAGRTALLSC